MLRLHCKGAVVTAMLSLVFSTCAQEPSRLRSGGASLQVVSCGLVAGHRLRGSHAVLVHLCAVVVHQATPHSLWPVWWTRNCCSCR